ncbi:FTR1 family protein [uncultured Pyramidobacter sp.]|uniref:FTR1 family iron permease n=1 Tax=uncultured Pyramidobacter sp. TaxID=1623495 RepID=UPI00258CB3B1|nr:FTR1 family protein [uncultured Pyramidobacter sp.]
MQTKNKVWRGWSLGLLAVAVLFLLLFSLAQDASAAKKKKYDTWKAVAADMAIEFSRARENVEKGEYKAAHKNMNDAYFGYYEIQGFEKNVMVAISSARVNHIEGKFSAIKHVLLGNNDSMDKATLVNEIEDLKVKVYKDAMVLDGDISDTDPDSLGEAVYGSAGKPAPYGAEAVAADKQAAPETPAVAPADQGAQPARSAAPKRAPVSRDWLTFLTAFGLLVREGLEAILVIVAIVAYLIKTGNKPMIRSVYLGCFAAILASAALAWFLEYMMGDASGVARELLEGWTMFLAVAVLFYVSNWMLSKADTERWENYIGGKVRQSIDSKSRWTLIFAAFIAVMREGAELILFYKAAFTGGMNSVPHIVYGILAGTAVLVAVWVAFRYFSVKLPLKPFFLFTSILLFLMCISFMGKGVVELTEADVITGRTVIPAMKGFSIEILSIYDRAETLIPQIMILIASLWVTLPRLFGKKKNGEAK